MSKPSSSHHLLRLVDANKNSLKCALVKYIDVTVERQFGQFRNQIMEMIESGDIVLGDVNASNNNDDDDDYSEDDGESISDYAECEDCVKGICGLGGENGDNADNLLSKKVDTQIGLRQDAQPNGSLANGDIIPDAIDNSNQSVHNVNDNLNNVAITTSIQRQDTQQSAGDEEDVNGEDQQNNTSIPSSAFYVSNDQITLPPTNDASLKSGHLIPDVIDDSNQSANYNASNDLSTLNNENEKQIRKVRKSKKNVPTKQRKSVQSVQPVIEHNQQSIASTSSERRSSRKSIPTKLFFNDQSCGQMKKKNKRKINMTESSKAVKKVKSGTGGDDDNEDDDGIEVPEKSGKEKIVTLELNCPEPDCKTILDTTSMWNQHLSTVHGLVPFKQLEESVRKNQRGKWEYPCTDCASVCKNQKIIIVHWRTFHQAGKFKCNGCEFVGNLRKDVLKHQRTCDHTTNGTEVGNATEKVVILKLDCIEPGCKAILNTLEMWKQHLSTVHGQMQPYKHLDDNVRKNQHGKLEYVCTECEVVRSNLESISGHWRQNHQKGKFKCCDCEFVANLRQEVYQHRRTSHNKKDKDSLNRGEDL